MVFYDLLCSILEFGWPTFILGAILLLLLFQVFTAGTVANLPPTIGFRLPVIGHMLQFSDSDKRIPLRKFREKIGNVYSLYLGQQLVIIVAGYDLIIEILRRQDFIDRPRLPLDRILKVKKLGYGTSGQFWKEQRGFALSTLKDLQIVKGEMEPRVKTEVRDFLSAISNQQGKPFNPHELIVRTLGNIIHSLVFGRQFNRDDERFKHVISLYRKAINNGSANVVQIIPCLNKMPWDLFKYKELSKTFETVRRSYRILIDEHLEQYDESDIDCFASAYIKELNMQNDNPTTSFSLDCLAVCVENMQFGADALISAINWCLAFLAENPEMQQRMYTEIAEHVGIGNTPSAHDRSKLPYVVAFYTEILRFCNTSFLNLPRAAVSETELGGYTIPINATILIDFDSIVSDETIWEDPKVFRPDRFLDENGLFNETQAFMPFSSGPRDCVGKAFAKLQLFLWLSCTVQKFKIEKQEGADLSMKAIDGQFTFTHYPKPFNIVVIGRE